MNSKEEFPFEFWLRTRSCPNDKSMKRLHYMILKVLKNHMEYCGNLEFANLHDSHKIIYRYAENEGDFSYIGIRALLRLKPLIAPADKEIHPS